MSIKDLYDMEQLESEQTPIEVKPETEKTEIKTEEKKPETTIGTFNQKLELIESILNVVRGGGDLYGKVDPVLRPKEIYTTTNISKGEVRMITALSTFAKCSPKETECVLDYCITYLKLKLSEEGFGIIRAIELGKALTETETTTTIERPEKPTEGMKGEKQ